MLGKVDKGFRQTKQERYEEEYKPNTVSNQLREAGGGGEHPFLSLLEAQEQRKWSEKDDAKYLSGSGMRAARIDNPQATVPVERQRDYTLNSKNNLEAASDYRSKKEGRGSKKKGATGSLKINKKKPKLNTQTNNPQSGLNI